MTLEEAMVKVWRQAMVEGAAEVELDGKTFAVRETPRKRLREVDFVFDGQPSRETIRDTKIVLRGLEQNPKTESRCAQLARAGDESKAGSRETSLCAGRPLRRRAAVSLLRSNCRKPVGK